MSKGESGEELGEKGSSTKIMQDFVDCENEPELILGMKGSHWRVLTRGAVGYTEKEYSGCSGMGWGGRRTGETS